jgi:hypothetical protein
MPGGAVPCTIRADVAFYVTFGLFLRHSPRKQQFTLFLLGELSSQGIATARIKPQDVAERPRDILSHACRSLCLSLPQEPHAGGMTARPRSRGKRCRPRDMGNSPAQPGVVTDARSTGMLLVMKPLSRTLSYAAWRAEEIDVPLAPA